MVNMRLRGVDEYISLNFQFLKVTEPICIEIKAAPMGLIERGYTSHTNMVLNWNVAYRHRVSEIVFRKFSLWIHILFYSL